MSEHADAVAGLAEELLAAGEASALVEQLADPEVLALLTDTAVVAALGEAHGRHVAMSGLLNVVSLRSGSGVLLLPRPGPADGAAVVSSGTLEVDGVIVRSDAPEPVVCVVGEDSYAVPGADLVIEPLTGLDGAAGLARVTGRVPLDGLAHSRSTGGELLSRAARFTAHELLGVADGALALALDHVRSRRQFGVPIGSFQSVRHRLVDAHVQITAARELLAAVPADAGTDLHLLVLKAAAGRAALTAVAAAQQVCGGMGFTEEFGLHRFVRRAYVLDSLLGGCEAAEQRLGVLALMGHVLPDRTVVIA